MSDFSTNLKRLREKAGLTRLDLANAANVSNAAIGYYELGKREPHLSTLILLASALHVSTDELLGYTSDARKKANYTFAAYELNKIGFIVAHNKENDKVIVFFHPNEKEVYPLQLFESKDAFLKWFQKCSTQAARAMKGAYMQELEGLVKGQLYTKTFPTLSTLGQMRFIKSLDCNIFSSPMPDLFADVDGVEDYKNTKDFFDAFEKTSNQEDPSTDSAHEKSAKADDSDQGAKKG